jgi:hypothetical protein
MNSEHDEQPFLVDLEDCYVFLNQGKAKVAKKDKQPWAIVEFLHLSTMVASYHRRFIIHSHDKKISH